jgi:predicted HTH domain antitoxin
MTKVEIPVDEQWMASRGVAHAALEAEFRLLLAAKLFELQRVTLVQAAQMAGMNLWDFTTALGRLQISPVNLSPAELADDLARA